MLWILLGKVMGSIKRGDVGKGEGRGFSIHKLVILWICAELINFPMLMGSVGGWVCY